MELPFEDEIFNSLAENTTVVGGIDADRLAERIAKTNELVHKIKLLETENEKYLNNALELSQSVQGIKALYDEERSKCENLQRENDELRKDILKTRADLAEKEAELSRSSLKHEQSIAEWEDINKKDTRKYLALCETVALEFINQANLLNDNDLLDKQAHRKVNSILKKLSEINLTIPVLKSPRKCSKKERVSVAEKCEKVSKMDAAVDCNFLPTPEPQKQMVSRATQYVTSTTTRAASTSAFIKTRTIGTIFPEPLTVTVEEALKATVFDLPKPISPINEINFPVARSAGTQTEIFSSKTVGTCTKVRNIRKTVKQLFDNDFVAPIKTESPMNSMENLSYTPLVDSKSGSNLLPVSVQLMDLWNMLGQRLFSAMRNGSALHQEQLRAVNERIDMLHLHLQMEILNCLNLITTENNFCMDNYLFGSMGELPRKRKLSESSEVSFIAGEFEAVDESMKSWKRNGEEFTLCDPGHSFQQNPFISTDANDSEKIEFRQHTERVGDQAVREFFSMGKSSNNSTQESSVICPDILNNSRKSVIIRTKEVKSPRISSVNTLKTSLEETPIPNQSSEDIEMNSGSFTEISKMSDLSPINDLVQTPIKEKSTEIDGENILVEAKDPTDLTNNLIDSEDGRCRVEKSLEITEVGIEQPKECKKMSKNKEDGSCNNKKLQGITAVDIVLKIFSSSSAKKSNIKLKRLKRGKLAKNKLINKEKNKSLEKESCGLQNLKKPQETFVANVSSLPESHLTDSSSKHIEDSNEILISKNQNLFNKFGYKSSDSNADTSQNGSKEKISNENEKRKLTIDSNQISRRMKTNTELSSSAESQDNSAFCEQLSSSDTEDVEQIFKACILNICPISRLSESSSENEDTFRMDLESNSYEETSINISEIKNSINILGELDTPQSPPRIENHDYSFAVTIPLERVSEHDFNYSPQSPTFERNFDDIPKTVIIPENNTIKTNLKKQSLIGRKINSVLGKILDNFEKTRNIRLMKKKVLTEPLKESKLLIKVRQILEHYIMNSAQSIDVAKCTLRILERTTNKEIICKAIIEVIEDTKDQVCNVQTPPAPPMTETHKKILVLVHKLNLYFKEFSRNLMSTVEQRLFNLKEDKLSLEVVINNTLLYIGLIDIDSSNKNPARLFIYKCLYYHNKKAIPMIYYILVSYPNVLPKQTDPHYDRSDALISTIQCILNSMIYTMDKRDLKHREVFHILRMYYEYERVKPSREEVVENLMAKIKAGKPENVSFSFALLCKHFGLEWTEREIINKYVLPAVTECYNFVLSSDRYDRQAAVLLETLSLILKPFPLKSSITRYQQIFTNFLYATDRKIIQDAAVCAILRTQRFSYVDCFNSICNWNPNYNIDKNIRAMLNSFVYRKPLMFWRKIINQI